MPAVAQALKDPETDIQLGSLFSSSGSIRKNHSGSGTLLASRVIFCDFCDLFFVYLCVSGDFHDPSPPHRRASSSPSCTRSCSMCAAP